MSDKIWVKSCDVCNVHVKVMKRSCWVNWKEKLRVTSCIVFSCCVIPVPCFHTCGVLLFNCDIASFLWCSPVPFFNNSDPLNSRCHSRTLHRPGSCLVLIGLCCSTLTELSLIACLQLKSKATPPQQLWNDWQAENVGLIYMSSNRLQYTIGTKTSCTPCWYSCNNSNNPLTIFIQNKPHDNMNIAFQNKKKYNNWRRLLALNPYKNAIKLWQCT